MQWKDDALDSLIIREHAKSYIHTLVKQQITADGAASDIINGKGGGLIGLLDGSPGCGKTLTAEAIAEATHRPLYAVSAGELGVTSSVLDKRLSMILEIAYRWKAVVLLDEADVFLRQRDPTNIERNALVSIFLRQLEYFQGILIMTTNRLEDCDTAFQSRCHFWLHYPDLDRASQKLIWRSCLELIGKSGGVDVEVYDMDIENLTRNDLNGREVCIDLSESH